MRSFKAVIIATFLAALSAVSLLTHAAVARADDACALTSADFAKITAVQNNPSLSSNEEMAQELALRKQLATRVLTCAQAEVATLQKTLSGATTTADTKNIQSHLLSDLNDAVNFYNIEAVKLGGAGISGSKAVAHEIIAWRAGTYVPLEGKINNYLLWTQNQSLFDTAQSRMDQTQRAVAFMESASNNSDLQAAFDDAYASFQNAKQENDSAKKAIMESLPPDQSLALIKQSLNSLSDTYQKFFAVSSVIKKLLP